MKYLKVKEVAERLDVNYTTALRVVKKAGLAVRFGKLIRVDSDKLEHYLSKKTIMSKGD